MRALLSSIWLHRIVWSLAVALSLTLGWMQSASAVGSQGEIQSGDEVSVQVYKHPDLTVTTTVGANGFISYPLIGQVKIAGMTQEQAAAQIAEGLRIAGYITEPQVTVYIRQSVAEEVSVLGEVGKPGRYPITKTSNRLFDVLAMAGGLNSAAGYEVMIIRPKAPSNQRRIVIDIDQTLRSGNISQDPPLNAGDVVYVPKALVVYIYGYVKNPGAYPLSPHMTVRQLISLAGGLAAGASTGGIEIVTHENGKTVKRGADLSSELSANVVVHVPQSLF